MKKVIIMGASSGIGLYIARALARGGVRVGLAARHTSALLKLKNEFPDMVEYCSIDITRPHATIQLKELIDKTGGMDIYFHVSGIGFENQTLDPAGEVRIIETNSTGFARMISTAYRWMRDHGVRGQIAAVTSVAGTNGIGRLSAYSSSKKFAQTYLVALEQLATSENSGISFTDIRPGWVRTPLLSPDARYPMEMDLDYAGPLILKAIVQKKRVAVIDWRWNLIVGLWRIIPNALWTMLDIPVAWPDQSLPIQEPDK